MEAVRQTVELFLSEPLIPPHVHVKQFDNGGRLIICGIYLGSTLYELTSDISVNVSGLRPDGEIFQYGSETDSSVVSISDGAVNITVTEDMTCACGRAPVDVTLLDGDNIVGAFSFMLCVEKAAVNSKAITTGSYAGLSAFAEGMSDAYINENGYLVIESDDGLELTFETDSEGKIYISYGGG